MRNIQRRHNEEINPNHLYKVTRKEHQLKYLLGDDAEAAISHAVLDERPGGIPRGVPSADDHIPAVRRSANQTIHDHSFLPFEQLSSISGED